MEPSQQHQPWRRWQWWWRVGGERCYHLDCCCCFCCDGESVLDSRGVPVSAGALPHFSHLNFAKHQPLSRVRVACARQRPQVCDVVRQSGGHPSCIRGPAHNISNTLLAYFAFHHHHHHCSPHRRRRHLFITHLLASAAPVALVQSCHFDT